MILTALNGNKLEKYFYSHELQYKNKNFNGHQIGINIGITDTITKDIIESHVVADEKNEILQSIIDDETIIKIEKPITMIENGKLVYRTLWFLPYAVKDHSVFRETVNFNNIVPSTDVNNHVVLELLFVEDNLNRYVTYSYDTHNVSIMEAVKDIFDNENEGELATLGIHYDTVDGESGYYLDFYDEAGEKFMICFERLDRLYDAIVSVRLLEVDTTFESN